MGTWVQQAVRDRLRRLPNAGADREGERALVPGADRSPPRAPLTRHFGRDSESAEDPPTPCPLSRARWRGNRVTCSPLHRNGEGPGVGEIRGCQRWWSVIRTPGFARSVMPPFGMMV